MQAKNNDKAKQPVNDILKAWKKCWMHINSTNMQFVLFTESHLSTSQKIKAGTLIKQWRALTKSLENFYDLLEQRKQNLDRVEPVEVKLPFEDDPFVESWKLWKEYLMEQFSIKISTRAEIKQLKRLKELSQNDQEKACKIIDTAMAYFYKGFYPLDDLQNKNKREINLNNREDDFK